MNDWLAVRTRERVIDWAYPVILVVIGSFAFVNLRDFPPFVDEGIDLWWIWRIAEAGEWLRPLRDGKPLEAWPVIPFLRFAGDPLIVGRLLHVGAGIVGTLLVYALARRISTRNVAFICGVLTALCPFVVFLERLSLADSYLFPAGVLVLFTVARFHQTRTWKSAVALGIGLVLAAFAKFPIGFAFMAAWPLLFIGAPAADRLRFLDAKVRLKLLAAYAPVVVLLCAVAVVVVIQARRGELPGFGLHMIFDKTQSTDRGATIGANAARFVDDATAPLTWPVAILAMLGVMLSLWKGSWSERWLAIWGIAAILAIVAVSTLWSSRYYLFAIPPLIVSSVCGWRWLWQTRSRLRTIGLSLALIVSGGLMAHQSALLIFDPPSARWSKADAGYVSSWASGYGFSELSDYLQSSPAAPSSLYTFEVGTAMQLRAQLPPEWSERVQQIQIVDGKALSVEERRAYLLTKAPAWLVTHSAWDESDDYVAKHLRRIAAFHKPLSSVEVTLYDVVGN